MNHDSMWTTAIMARELAFIREVLELQIALAQQLGRMPSPSEIQAACHATQHGDDVHSRSGDPR